jgi:predicted amidohydrolase YtcJ
MAVNGVVANVQPQFVHTDSAWASRRLPPGLLSHAYAWKSLLTAGIRVAGGSDAPVEVPDPFLGLFCAVHRPTSAFPLHASRAALMADPNSHVPTHQVWRPHERLSIGEALHLYTHSAAYASMREGDLGTLRAGKLADFAVLSHDIVSDPCPATMLAANALQVWVGGRCVKRGAWLAGDLPVAEVHVNKPLRANL